MAKPKILVIKKGNVYCITSREQPKSTRVGRPPSSLEWLPYTPQARGRVPGAQEPFVRIDQPRDLWPQLITAISRLDSRHNVIAASAQGVPGLGQLRLKKAPDLQVGNASEPPENIWIAPRYLGWLWPKADCRPPLAVTAYEPGAQRSDRPQNLPLIQNIKALFRDVSKNFLTYAQTVSPGADFLTAANPFSYCFPVAPPYSFRDTWGDWRSGGRFHQAVDIVAADGTPVFAITTGVIHTLATWPGAGISLFLRGQDGRVYGYMHLQGYAEGIVEGKPVTKGELIAYVGHTGIKWDAAHLHLQVYADDSLDRDKLINPYALLVQLSNGNGVTDWFAPIMAHRQIPAAEITDLGPVSLSSSVPRRYQAGKPKIMDVSTWLSNNY